MTDTKPINPFSPDYASQIKPFRNIPFKAPVIEQPKTNARMNIAPDEEGKRGRMLKSNI